MNNVDQSKVVTPVSGQRPRGSQAASPQPPLTAAEIVETAVTLTAEQGLAGWSNRILAERVGCWPTAVVHRVGNREVVERAVVGAVLSAVTLPDESLEWDAWYRELLGTLRTVLVGYPGVARWLDVGAPLVPEVVEIADVGVRRLQDAGFDEEAAAAHIALLNTAVHFIAAEDERSLRADRVHELREGLAELSSSGRSGAAAFARALTGGMDLDVLYRYVIDRMIDGVAARLEEQGTGV